MKIHVFINKKEKKRKESIDGTRTLCIMENVDCFAGGDSTYRASHVDNKQFSTTHLTSEYAIQMF